MKLTIIRLLTATGWYAICSYLVNLPTLNATQSPYRGPLILVSSLAIWTAIQRWLDAKPAKPAKPAEPWTCPPRIGHLCTCGTRWTEELTTNQEER